MDSYLDGVEAFRDKMEAFVRERGNSQGLSLSSQDDVMKYVEQEGVSSIRLWFTDILGFQKAFSLTPSELEGAFEEGMGFDGSSIHGYQRINESDMVAVPIAETAELIPFRIGGSVSIRMFAEIRTPDGSPYGADPRNILKRNLTRLDDYGYTDMFVGPEAEYFYFANDRNPEIIDRAGYFDIVPVDLGDDLREATVFALESMGIQVEYMHHEVGPSQHEIDLKYDKALRMADALQTYKWIVKEVARRNGVHATFMPKPLAGENGSGMHTHISIFTDGRNEFYDPDSRYHLSGTAGSFIAGCLDHAREMALVTNQWYNSYKRLVVGYEAPVYIAWAERNRSALIRVPLYKPGKELATRIELRFPDAACNPYLAFAIMLAAGLDGLDRKAAFPEPMTADLYKFTAVEREQQNIQSLPHDLYEAIQVAEGSELLRETLGAGVVDKLVETKLSDYDKFHHHISLLDLDHHMQL